jgi:hypothetical protein
MARIDDGHSTTVTFASQDTVLLWEKEVTPPGIEGGGANDTTTMLNTAWRTKAPKKLVSLTDAAMTVAYDPAFLDDVLDMINENQTITITFPDGSTWVFWGWLDTFVPNACVEGEQPTAQCTIIPSNQSSSGSEIAPVYTPA